MARGRVNTGSLLTRITISNDVTDNYVLAPLNANTLIKAASATPITITIPLNATSPGFVIGDCIQIVQFGDGAITIAIEATGTLLSKNYSVIIDGKYAGVIITKIDTDTWLLIGALF